MISDINIPEILPTGICTYEHVVANVPVAEIVSRAAEVRGLTIKVEKVPIPVPFGAGFEGERVRKEDMFVQFGGKYTDAFELLRMVPMDQIEDGHIEVVGPEIEDMEEGAAYPLGIMVEVAGRDFQEDFESVLERRIHEYISCANGIFHMGQRSIIWLRISKETQAKGFKIKDFGEILCAKIHNDFSSIVDRVQVKVITDPEAVKAPLEEAKSVYDQRDDRIGGMTDEDVEDFYSCTLCQSYAPDHVCIVTPQRLGLCGAYTWLDCKASFQIDEHGPNEPVIKGNCLDADKGQWQNVNDYVSLKSNGNLERFNAYSILEEPMTSCGCFECIAAIVPEANGIVVVDRDFQGMTPIGMKFSTLAGQIGGGTQTPGFIGIGKLYISSGKFISAEGGIERVVWMPQALKEEVAERLQERLRKIGKEDLFDKIATEENAEDPEALVEYLQQVGSPGPGNGSLNLNDEAKEIAMALTAMGVYKSLPKTNCKECGFPTCMAFAMQVAAKQKALTDCTQLSDEAKDEFSDSAAPPMRLVSIGAGDNAVQVGQETVMFRHEDKFHKQPAITARLPAALSDDEALVKLEQINASVFSRVGQELAVRLTAVEIQGLTADQATARLSAVAGKSRTPLIVMTDDPAVMAAAIAPIAAQKAADLQGERGKSRCLRRDCGHPQVPPGDKCRQPGSSGGYDQDAQG